MGYITLWYQGCKDKGELFDHVSFLSWTLLLGRMLACTAIQK